MPSLPSSRYSPDVSPGLARPASPATVAEHRVRAFRLLLYRLRAWMLVLPVDAVMLLAPALWTPWQIRPHLAMAVLFLLMVTRGGRYRARLHLSVLDELPGLLARLLAAAALVATVSALRHDQVAATRFLDDAAVAVGLVIAGRALTTFLINHSRRRRWSVHPTILVGSGPLAAELARILDRYPRYGLRVVGYVSDDVTLGTGPTGPAGMRGRRLGGVADLDDAVRATGANVLLVTDGDVPEAALATAVRGPAGLRCDLLIVPRLHHFHTQTGLADHIGSVPVMRIHQPNLAGSGRLLKRGFDVLAAAIGLVVVAPVLGVCALAVRLDTGPDVIFRQTRVGRDGRLFDLYKLRSMHDRPAGGDPATEWAPQDADRVSAVGRFLRRTSLDELPQLWNVLRGDMTLVGPRPERPYFVEQFTARYERYGSRHRMQVGLTGLAQVSGLRGDTSIADRARHDNYYIENWSLWLDIKIILRTVFEVLRARGR